jgi:hypothetical protein
MLRLNSEGTTTVTVTLYENCNLRTPYFTWLVKRKGSLDEIIFTQDDISFSPYYFNQFALTIATSSEGLTAGVIPITSGEWNYYIYEQSTPYVLATSSNMVETGILIVEGTYSEPTTYTGLTDNVIKVYRG